MGAAHSHALYHHAHTRVHRLAPETKVVAAFGFVAAVAITPRHAVWAFALHALAIGVVVGLARLPPRFVLARLAVVVPFVAFAFLFPFVGEGERIAVLGAELSRDGLWATFNVVAKAGLGAVVSIVLAGTTEPARILHGLERLHVPRALTSIALFMLRFLEVLADELSRMRTALVARGHAARWLWQAKPLAAGAGTLFVRGYERGERVYDAMASRGFSGTMPDLSPSRTPRTEWAAAAALPALGLAVAVTAIGVGP